MEEPELHCAEGHRDDSLRGQMRNEDHCSLKEDHSESSEERGLNDLVKKHAERPEATTKKVQEDRDDPTGAVQCQRS